MRSEHQGPPRTRCQPSGPCRSIHSRMICSVVSRSNRTTASPSAGALCTVATRTGLCVRVHRAALEDQC
jgi:hypothetical protein